MRYFRIEESLNRKIMGHLPQTKDVIHHCDVWETPTFIDNIGYNKIDYTPIVSNLILFPKAKTTDLLDGGGMGFFLKFVMSNKLKSILEKYSENRFQFFECPIFHKGIEYKNYYIINPYKIDMEFIDYGNSKYRYKKRDSEGNRNLTEIRFENFQDFQDFLKILNPMDEFTIKNIALISSLEEHFFALENVEGGRGYFVSENLKNEIEVAGCTGIEFQPIELSFHEWSVSGGERDRVYGKSW
ncbi:imm11 family protein [Flavobacterium sp. TSSA_36]|uniref:imm11 family protein n=1 Tax=Flavobacterium sp. TSSA_36 TaxID=3447669 RepID=UPI003F2E627C